MNRREGTSLYVRKSVTIRLTMCPNALHSCVRACDEAMANVGVDMKRTAPGSKCAMTERAIRTIKDRARATYLGMREKLPGRYWPELILDTI